MKSVLSKALAAILLFTAPLVAMAQKVTINDVVKVTQRSSGPIIQQNEVKGYYFFYLVDKVDRKTNSYLLKIVDQNLNEIASKKMEDSRTLYLQEGAFDGENIMLEFFDPKVKTVEMRKFSPKAELLSTKKIVLKNNMEMLYYAQDEGSGSEIAGNHLFALKGKGFANYTPVKNSTWGYRIDFVGSGTAVKDWTFSNPTTDKEHATITFLAFNDGVLYSSVTKRKSLLSKDMNSSVLAIDVATGKKIFETPVTNDKYEISVMNSFIDNSGNTILAGQYYKKGEKEGKTASLGLAYIKLDKTGKLVDPVYHSWEKDISKHLSVDARGRIKDVGYLYFHDFVQTADGKIYGVAESYRKAASGMGIAMMAMSGGRSGTSVTKIIVQDMYMFRFNPDLSLDKVNVFDKATNSVEMPAGAEYLSPITLGYYVNYYGWFDYAFTNPTKDKSSFSVGYTSYEKNKGEKKKWILGAITPNGTDYATDKITLETSATSTYVWPGKPGYVMVMEYFKKEKKIETRLEKINY